MIAPVKMNENHQLTDIFSHCQRWEFTGASAILTAPLPSAFMIQMPQPPYFTMISQGGSVEVPGSKISSLPSLSESKPSVT